MIFTLANHAWLQKSKNRTSPIWVGWILSFLAWLMMITPFMSPIWDAHPTLGHGICIELAPVIMATQHQLTDTISPSHKEHHHHAISHASHDPTHQHSLTHHKDKDKSSHHHHDCDICLSLAMYALGASLPTLVLFAVMFMERLIAFLRQLRLQYLFFLRPPSRASPAVFLNHF